MHTIIGKPEPAVAQLSTEDSVLLAQILDRVLLLLIHPSGDRQEQKAKRVEGLQHRFCRLPFQLDGPRHRLRFNDRFQ